jgi:hypothetical protein
VDCAQPRVVAIAVAVRSSTFIGMKVDLWKLMVSPVAREKLSKMVFSSRGVDVAFVEDQRIVRVLQNRTREGVVNGVAKISIHRCLPN